MHSAQTGFYIQVGKVGVFTRGLLVLSPMDQDSSIGTKKKTRPIACKEPIEKKKKKKNVTQDPELKEEPHSEIQKKALTNCKKNNSLTEETAAEADEEHLAEHSMKKKKKKKKSKLEEEGVPDALLAAEDDGMDDLGQNCLELKNGTSGKPESLKKKKKKKRKKKDKYVLIQEQAEEQEELQQQGTDEVSPVKKKKGDVTAEEAVCRLKSQPETTVTCTKEAHVETRKKKKKHKHVLLQAEVEEQEEVHKESDDEIYTINKKKSDTVVDAAGHRLNNLPETIETGAEEPTKKKKKKRCHKQEEMAQPTMPEQRTEMGGCGLEHNITSSCSKTKKKAHITPERIATNDDGGSSKNKFDESQNKNNLKRQMSDGVPKEMSESKKKKKVHVKQEEGEAMEPVSNVELVWVKNGNTDEVKIDKIRRLALQAEVDRESGKIKASSFGQWETASFENPEEKNKFLRLMGGFKKSSQLTPVSPAGIKRPNLALCKAGEETLKNNLFSEFEKAVELKHHRGIGLGFQPAANKTFYIDKTKSRSIKFDD